MVGVDLILMILLMMVVDLILLIYYYRYLFWGDAVCLDEQVEL